MTIRLFDALTAKVDDLATLTPGEVKVYVDAFTAKGPLHAGHARTLVLFDALYRFLRAHGLKITVCAGYTDASGEITRRAAELGERPDALARREIDRAAAQLRALGCAPPDASARLSKVVPEVTRWIEGRIADGHALAASGGEVRAPLGGAPLWEPAADDESAFDAPWGRGRPGRLAATWGMASRHLGERYDLYGAGEDRREAEPLGPSAEHGGPRFWLYAGLLTVGGSAAEAQPMSEARGNTVPLRALLERHDPEAFRTFALSSHYRSALWLEVTAGEGGALGFPGLAEAERRTDYLYATKDALVAAAAGEPPRTSNVLQGQAAVVEAAPGEVLEALDEDFDTPRALAQIVALAKASNEILQRLPRLQQDPATGRAARGLAARAARAMERACVPLGLLQTDSESYWSRTRARRLKARGLAEADIARLVQERAAARAAKDFARADALRGQLAESGVEVSDDGTKSTWRIGV